jgi:hypothetical protein
MRVKKVSSAVLVAFCVWGTCNTPLFGPIMAEEASKQPDTSVTLDSKEMAAFLVAYEDYRSMLMKDGITLTPGEFVKRHYAVRIKREGSRVDVYFYPDSKLTLGGDVGYLVDTDRLNIAERFFGR